MISDKELLDYIDGRLTVSRSEEVRRLIENNPDLKKRYKHLAGIDALLSKEPGIRTSPSFADHVMANLSKKVVITGLYNGFWKRNLVIVLSIVIVGFIAGVVLLSNFSLSDILPALQPQEITVSQRTINLDPGKINFINQDLFIKGLIYLNAFLGLFLLERAVLKPFFRQRRQNYSF